MSLAAGSRIGSYEVIGAIGAGGMGEVYRARDTRLNRDVALKILPEIFASDPERLARFEREAQVLASLNHPHIAAIHGIEDSDGMRALVLEFVDGETLADRIARGPVPIDEALPIARQIAEALEAAHEQGIIHRDLKPANIKLRDDGTVKVLDFGLAKLTQPAAAPAPGAASASLSPTITSPALVTGVGMLLGTAAYMSPEQAKGREADKRSDIWAFGCVLFEMLTGKRAFEGNDVIETLAAVVRGEPDWNALPPDVPVAVRTLLRRCVDRDLRRRVSDLSTVRFVLDEPLSASAPAASHATSRRGRLVAGVAAIVAALALVAAAIALTMNRGASEPRAGVMRFLLPLPNGQEWTSSASQIVAISPDGTSVVYAANQQLYIRTMADTEARVLEGTGASPDTPFFSPDGRWLGFYVPGERKLKKVALTGGPAITICDADLVSGASWADDDRIYFGQSMPGIVRVAANGGKPEVVVPRKQGEIMHGPQLLADGDTLLFTLATARSAVGWDRAHIVAQSLKTGNRTLLIEGGSDARFVTTGHLLYAVGATVLALPFDVAHNQVTGTAIPVLENVRRAPPGRIGTGTAQFAVSRTGTLAYIEGANAATDFMVAIIDRTGRRRVLNLPAGAYGNVRFSPDGRQLALSIDDGRETAVWIHEIGGATAARRLTFEGRNSRPTWTPDGRRIAFRSERNGEQTVAWQAADGSGVAERIGTAEPGTTLQPEVWSADGSTLLLSVSTVGGGERSLAMLHPGREARPTPLVPTYATNSTLSPDGRWFAYYADLGDHNAIFVQPFPVTGAKYVLPGDGKDPLWSRDGRLFFLRNKGAAAELMAVPIHTSGGVTFGEPVAVGIEEIYALGPRAYDIAPDGQSFAVVTPKRGPGESARPDRYQITLNWFQELRQRAPAAGR